jgi:hypothetical protein
MPAHHARAHAVHLPLQFLHLVFAAFGATAVTHVTSPKSSGCEDERERDQAQRPPDDKAQNHQRDPGEDSELIDFHCDRHGALRSAIRAL